MTANFETVPGTRTRAKPGAASLEQQAGTIDNPVQRSGTSENWISPQCQAKSEIQSETDEAKSRGKNPRSSIFISERDKTIIICNKKNGFTTLNTYLDGNRFSRHIKNGIVLRRFLNNAGSNYRKILIKRDPFARIYSFYSDWLVNKDENFITPSGKRNVHYQNLKKAMTETEYEQFCSSRSSSNTDRFYLFMKHLKQIFYMNPHTHPQAWLYRSAGLKVQDFDHVIDTTDLSSELSDLLQMEIGHRHKSRDKQTHRPGQNDERLLRLCSDVYASDYQELGYPLPAGNNRTLRGERKRFYIHLAKLLVDRHTLKSFFKRR